MGGSITSLCKDLNEDEDDDVSGDGTLRDSEDSSELVVERLELEQERELDDDDDDDDEEDEEDDDEEDKDEEDEEGDEGDCGLGVG